MILATLVGLETQRRKKDEPVGILKPRTLLFLAGASCAVAGPSRITNAAADFRRSAELSTLQILTFHKFQALPLARYPFYRWVDWGKLGYIAFPRQLQHDMVGNQTHDLQFSSLTRYPLCHAAPYVRGPFHK
ncbi:hypothetical protein ElyMa_005742700 [Elysia marginata]|uniref:Uncharacterized protein n=1 Tax=Elysia marginata TaxID=1093978 RepID=A0AAV4FKE4_9GAST|nr:hypothetical protein ElyMa_005742700 [Elysia marginata]